MIPSLNYTRRDLLRDFLSEDDQRMIVEGMRTSLHVLDESPQPSEALTLPVKESATQAPDSATVVELPQVLGCPARDETDAVGLEMLRQLLIPSRCQLEVASVDLLVSELVARMAESPPVAICIACLPPGDCHTPVTCANGCARLLQRS